MRTATRYTRSTIAMAFAWLMIGAVVTCASSGSSGPRSNPNVITLEQLEAQPAGDLYQAIERLKPNWLRVRNLSLSGGNTNLPQVHVDGVPRGDVTNLRSLDKQQVRQVEFMNASDATTRFGTGYSGGVILVTSRGRG